MFLSGLYVVTESVSEIAVPSKAQFAKRGTGQVVTIESKITIASPLG